MQLTISQFTLKSDDPHENQCHFTTMKNLLWVSPQTHTYVRRTYVCRKQICAHIHTQTHTQRRHLKYLKCNHRMHYKAVSVWESCLWTITHIELLTYIIDSWKYSLYFRSSAQNIDQLQWWMLVRKRERERKKKSQLLPLRELHTLSWSEHPHTE